MQRSPRDEAIVRDGFIRARVLARILGVTPAWLRMLAADGHIPQAERGYYPFLETLQRFIRYYRRRQRDRNRQVGNALIEARTRWIEVRTLKALSDMERRRKRRRGL